MFLRPLQANPSLPGKPLVKARVVFLVSLLQGAEQLVSHLVLEERARRQPELLLPCTEREVHAIPLERSALPVASPDHYTKRLLSDR